MKWLFILIGICQIEMATAQISKYIGINTPPVLTRTLEITSEIQPHPAYSVTLQTGYTFNTPFTGIDYQLIHEFIHSRRTSGFFYKLGGRAYLLSLGGNERSKNLFIGAMIIGSHYTQSAIYEPNDPANPINIPKQNREAKGTVFSPAITAGFSVNLSKSLGLDVGVQHALKVKRDDLIGARDRNYQPGMGAKSSDPVLGYVQGILNLKYRF